MHNLRSIIITPTFNRSKFNFRSCSMWGRKRKINLTNFRLKQKIILSFVSMLEPLFFIWARWLLFVCSISFTTGVILWQFINQIPLECSWSNPEVDWELLSPFGQTIVVNFEAVKFFCCKYLAESWIRTADLPSGSPRW